jgi:orotate phosphoribosyltransferase
MSALEYYLDVLTNTSTIIGLICILLLSSAAMAIIQKDLLLSGRRSSDIDHKVHDDKVRGVLDAIAFGITKSEYYLTSADGLSDWFFDADVVASDLNRSSLLTDNLIHLIQENLLKADYVGFLERDGGPVGVLTFQSLIADRLKVRTLLIRPDRRIWWTRVKMPGGINDLQGRRVMIVTDVVTTGRSVKAAIEAIQLFGATVPLAVAVAIRNSVNTETGRTPTEELRGRGTELIGIATEEQLRAGGFLSRKPVSH